MENKNRNKIVNTTLPAFIGDFEEQKELSSNKYVTAAKLKLFYTGTTGDKRRFTSDFAKKVLGTLCHTPVVGYYDEEKEDFIGHNEEQHIYGIVPNADYEIIEEDGKEWAVTNVLLFTGRQDSIGKIASKIVGRQHSLELDPDTIEYDMVVEGGYLKEIVFKEGSFIGLSVVGDSQQPAFEGSTFFLSKNCQEELESIKDFLGGIKMELNKDFVITPEKLTEYLKKSYAELEKEAFNKFKEMYPYVYNCSSLMEAGDDFVIVFSYDSYKFEKYSLTELKSEEVFPKFLTAEEVQAISEDAAGDENPINALETKENAVLVDKDEDDKSKCVEDDNEVEDKEEVEDEDFRKDDKSKCEKISENGEGVLPNAPTFTEEDRMELEAYRNKSKEKLLEKFREFLNDEEVASYKEKLADYTIEKLKTELSVKSMDFVLAAQQEQKEKAEKAAINSNVFTNLPKPNREEEIKSLIDRYK